MKMYESFSKKKTMEKIPKILNHFKKIIESRKKFFFYFYIKN